MDLEVLGAAIATTITYSLDFIFLIVYQYSQPNLIKSQKWFFLDKEAFDAIPIFLKYGAPASLMLVMEWWGYEFISIQVGWIGIEELAATVILFQIFALMFMNSLGITFAATSLVGNSLGENRPNKARTYAHATILFGAICTTVLVLGFVVLQETIINCFTTDAEVVYFFESGVIFYSIAMWFDLMQGVHGGMIRAIGYQNIATIIQFASLWLWMLPLCYFFGFVIDLGYFGVWMGVPFGGFALMIGYMWIIFTAPWQTLSIEASKDDKIIKDAEVMSNIHRSMLSHEL